MPGASEGTIVLLDYRTDEVVRIATRDDIASAAHYPGALLTYQFGDAYSFGRHGYLARATTDAYGNEITTALDDSEIEALARGGK